MYIYIHTYIHRVLWFPLAIDFSRFSLTSQKRGPNEFPNQTQVPSDSL